MVERPTLTDTASVRVLIPTDLVQGRSRGVKLTCVHPSVSGQHGQNGEASGLVPEVLHYLTEPDDMQRLLNEWYARMGQLIQEFEDTYGDRIEQPSRIEG